MKVERIILHHSLTEDGMTVSWGSIRRYHKYAMGWRDIGYHYGIERAGRDFEIMVGRFEHQDGAHTTGMNDTSLGICFVGNFDKHKVPKQQWELGVKLVKSFFRRYKHLTPWDVYGHRDFANKSCPGKNFNVEDFRNQLT